MRKDCASEPLREWQIAFPQHFAGCRIESSSPLCANAACARKSHARWGRSAIFNGVLLQSAVQSGRILSVKIEVPANHMTEESRWDYRVTIRFKNSTVATTTNPDEERFIHQLWPDQATYKHEEQRHFEILLSHWDLPVTDITPVR